MQPFVAAEAIRDDYRHYIETSFPVRDPALKAEIGQLIEAQKLLWQEVFVSLARPFRGGGSLNDLVGAGVLSPAISRVHWGLERLFAHQAAAARRPILCRHIMVATSRQSRIFGKCGA